MPSAAYLGAHRHLATLEKCSLSTGNFAALPDKHFFASTRKLATELFSQASDLLTPTDLEEINNALEIETELQFADGARAMLCTLRDTKEGQKASQTPLGSDDSAEARQAGNGAALGGALFLMGGVVGFIAGGIIGLLVAGFIGMVIVAICTMSFEDNDRKAVVEMHAKFRAFLPMFESLHLDPAEVLRTPAIGLDAIDKFESYAAEVLFRRGRV